MGVGGAVCGDMGGGEIAWVKSGGALEAVADLADGVEVAGVVGVGFDLGAERGDGAVDAAGGDEDGFVFSW